MIKFLLSASLLISSYYYSQTLESEVLLNDKISIRTLQIYKNRIYYVGTESKFGFVNFNNPKDAKQIRLSDKNLQFRALAQGKNHFYAINIESPAYHFTISKKDLKINSYIIDSSKTVFVDSYIFDSKLKRGIAISDPSESLDSNPKFFSEHKPDIANKLIKPNFPKYFEGEAHFAASNSNIAMKNDLVWIASGGMKARIFKFNWNNPFSWQVYETPFVQGNSTSGIYSIDFYDSNFGIAVGGDYTKQEENFNNIATTIDGGKTWQIRASGENAGYSTCVKFRPGTKGKDIIAIGDQHISLSQDYGKTWKKISNEKGFYVFDWINKNTIVLAGKDKIVKMRLKFD